MSKLKAVEPKKALPKKPKIMIFGRAGVGKTWASLDFPNVYYIDTEGGASFEEYTDRLRNSNGVYFGPEHGSLSFDTVIEQVKALATEKHPYKTVVIDSISKVFNLSIQEEADRLGDKDAFGSSKKPAIAAMRSLISWLNRIDMNVILIAHEKAEWFKGEQIGVTFDCWDRLDYELDLVLNIIKNGPNRIAKIKKSRIKAFVDGSNFEWSYKKFSEMYGRDVIEADVKEVEIVTEEQLSKLMKLIDLYKVEQATIDKWLKAANCDELSDMDADKAKAVIEMLEKKASELNKGEK